MNDDDANFCRASRDVGGVSGRGGGAVGARRSSQAKRDEGRTRGNDIIVTDEVVQCLWSVLLHPRQRSAANTHHAYTHTSHTSHTATNTHTCIPQHHHYFELVCVTSIAPVPQVHGVDSLDDKHKCLHPWHCHSRRASCVRSSFSSSFLSLTLSCHPLTLVSCASWLLCVRPPRP